MRLLYTLLAVLTMGIASAQSDPYPANTGGNYSVANVTYGGIEYNYIFDAREESLPRLNTVHTLSHYATTSSVGGPETFSIGSTSYNVVGSWDSYIEFGDRIEFLEEFSGWYSDSTIMFNSFDEVINRIAPPTGLIITNPGGVN